MQKIIDDLNLLGKEIEKAKSSVSQLTGREVEVVNRLKAEFGISTLPELEKEIEIVGKKQELAKTGIIADYEALKAVFSW